MSRWQKAKGKVENTTTMLRLLIVTGSGWLLWRRYQKEQMAEAIEAQAIAQGGSPAAMMPMTPASAQILPSTGPENPVVYQGMSIEQQETAAALIPPQVDNLSPPGTPGAEELIQAGSGWLTSIFG